ncbi:MAG: fumarylacetoacetate hydrolase family protein [Acidobacteriota bacterium]
MKVYVTSDGLAREAADGDLEILDLPARDLGETLTEDPDLDSVRGAAVKRRSALEDVCLCAPIARPGKVIGIGINYHSHVEETRDLLAAQGIQPPEAPMFFLAPGTAVIGPEDEIVLPAIAPDNVDYEIELVAVIGRVASNVAAADAMSHVVGYTLGNDVSARDVQRRSFESPEFSMSHAKGIDTFKPLGPALVTRDEFDEPLDVHLTTRVNGEVRQDSRTTDFVHSIASCVAEITKYMSLEPGDVIFTGSPAGVGVFSGQFLKHGDVVELEADRIGSLRNVVAKCPNSA